MICVCTLPGFGKEDNRHILALYNSTGETIYLSSIHQFIEMPLNRLGLIVDYHDITKRPFPDAAAYRGIINWYNGAAISNIGEYYRWLLDAEKKGVKLVFLNGVEVSSDSRGELIEGELFKQVLSCMGLQRGNINDLSNPFAVSCEKLNNDAFGFETDEDPENPVYRDYRITSDKLSSWMNISRSDTDNSAAVVVAAGKSGGFISDISIVAQYIETPVWGLMWNLNPFRFLAAALDIRETLKPDVTTSFGLRTAFMHIDGDGSSNLTQDISKTPVPCTQVFRENILEKYNFPVSVSAIGYRLSKVGAIEERFVKSFKEMIKAPQVQCASHTYTHPMYWADPNSSYLKVPGYNEKKGYDPVMETVGSMKYIEDMALKGNADEKKCELLLWSGDCMPTEAALAALYKEGLHNLNGGNPRVDDLYTGISHISPLTLQVGRYRQYYAPAGNEFLYTDGWQENFGGFAKVIDTFKNTVSPRYLPVDVYYHLYVVERRAGLNSLFKIYDWCKGQELNWLHALEYTRSIDGYLSARTGSEGDNRFWIENYSGLQTVRLDNETRSVDMKQSRNISGFTHFAGSLYVSLLPGNRAEIVLTAEPHTGLSLRASTGFITDFSRDEHNMTFKVRVYEPGFIEFAGVTGRLKVEIAGRTAAPLDKDGRRYALPAGLGEYLTVSAAAE